MRPSIRLRHVLGTALAPQALPQCFDLHDARDEGPRDEGPRVAGL
jgi:hypothetical protein